MMQLREFAQHKPEFDELHVEVVGISTDDAEGTRKAWDKAGHRQFTILRDPGAKVIREYGVLHVQGDGDPDIAIRTTLLIDARGNERWRRVSTTVGDIPRAADVLAWIRNGK